MTAPDPFAPPEVPTEPARPYGVIVRARDFRNQSLERRRAIALLARVESGRAEVVAAGGLPIVIGTDEDNLSATLRARFLTEMTTFPVVKAGPPDLTMFAGSVVIGAVLVCMGTQIHELEPAIGWASIGAIWSVVSWWTRRVEHAAIAAALVALGPRQAVGEGDGLDGIVALACRADAAPIGSDAWAAAFLAVAERHVAAEKPWLARRCVASVLWRRPRDGAAQAMAETLARTTRPS